MRSIKRMQLKSKAITPDDMKVFLFSRHITAKYGIFRKTGYMPALIFLKLFGTIFLRSLFHKSYREIINNYFTLFFHVLTSFLTQGTELKADKGMGGMNIRFYPAGYTRFISLPGKAGTGEYERLFFLQLFSEKGVKPETKDKKDLPVIQLKDFQKIRIPFPVTLNKILLKTVEEHQIDVIRNYQNINQFQEDGISIKGDNVNPFQVNHVYKKENNLIKNNIKQSTGYKERYTPADAGIAGMHHSLYTVIWGKSRYFLNTILSPYTRFLSSVVNVSISIPPAAGGGVSYPFAFIKDRVSFFYTLRYLSVYNSQGQKQINTFDKARDILQNIFLKGQNQGALLSKGGINTIFQKKYPESVHFINSTVPAAGRNTEPAPGTETISSVAGTGENILTKKATSIQVDEKIIADIIKEKFPEQINTVADKVYKIIEKRIVMEKDRRGQL